MLFQFRFGGQCSVVPEFLWECVPDLCVFFCEELYCVYRFPFALSIGTCLGCSGVAGLSIVFGVRVFVLSRGRCGCVLVGRAGLLCGRKGVFLCRLGGCRGLSC